MGIELHFCRVHTSRSRAAREWTAPCACRARNVHVAHAWSKETQRRASTTTLHYGAMNARVRLSLLRMSIIHASSGICVLSCVVFWSLYISSAYDSRAYEVARSSASYGHLVNGITLRPETFSTLVETWSPGTQVGTTTGNTLLLVTADSCPASERQLDVWLAFLATFHVSPGDQVVVLADGRNHAQRLIARLRERDIPYRVLQAARVEGMMLSAGISSTPYVIGIDADGRARLIARQLAPEVGHLFRRFFLRHH